jgi:hypothetical protein
MDISITARPGFPDFSTLPWNLPLADWERVCSQTEKLPKGPSRHPVIFVNILGTVFALKEMPVGTAEKEYNTLFKIEELHLSAVTPVGYAQTDIAAFQRSFLITRYLEFSIPFRNLFIGNRLIRYREHLLDAIAGLLVQLHLADIYWGDCSLSNCLFRRDAGALRAYLVDAETAEIYPDDISPRLRQQDLEIMEENINGELADLSIDSHLTSEIAYSDTGAYIRLRYQSLWEAITREDIIDPLEHYRIQERIRALNDLGFSVGDVELLKTSSGDQLRLRVVVTDRNFHHDQLLSLTGIEAEERQAQKMMNEIHELKATLSQRNNRSTPLSAAAYHWQSTIYNPTIERLRPYAKEDFDTAELYCQILEHKWYLSERAQRDVGHTTAIEDYLLNIAPKE